MQNQHQTLPLFSFAMYPDETRRYVQLDELINSGVSRTFIPTNKAHKRHCVSEQRGRTQSQGLTDEFMCALINWFTQRLSHVDITLVQGLIVDFCYDKLLTEDWKRRYRFSFALRKNSLVGYDSLMKNSPKKKRNFASSYENFGSEKFAAFFSSSRSFDSDSHGAWPPSLRRCRVSFPIQRQSIILFETVLELVHFVLENSNFADFPLYYSSSRTKNFFLLSLHSPAAALARRSRHKM